MGMGMVWAVWGVQGCAGAGVVFDSKRREEGQRYRDLYSVCVQLFCPQGVVFSSRHIVELRSYSSIPLVYIKQKVSDLFEVLTSAGFRELVLEIAPRSLTHA